MKCVLFIHDETYTLGPQDMCILPLHEMCTFYIRGTEMCIDLVMTLFVRLDVTLNGWRDVRIQLTTRFSKQPVKAESLFSAIRRHGGRTERSLASVSSWHIPIVDQLVPAVSEGLLSSMQEKTACNCLEKSLSRCVSEWVCVYVCVRVIITILYNQQFIHYKQVSDLKNLVNKWTTTGYQRGR